MSDIIGADAAKLAGLQIDTLQKVRNGKITLKQWEWFNNLSSGQREKLSGIRIIIEKPLPQRPDALFSRFRNVANACALSTEEQRLILGIFPTPRRGWKKSKDTLDRMALFIKIYNLAGQCFPVKNQDGARIWLERPNDAPLFHGGRPKTLILDGQWEDLFDTYNYLRPEAGLSRSNLL